MMRGDIYWADLGDPLGSEPGFRRPVLVIQDDAYNRSRLATVVVLGMTTNLGLSRFPGCVLISAAESGLPKDSVCNASQIRTIDRQRLVEPVGQLDAEAMFAIDGALRSVLGL